MGEPEQMVRFCSQETERIFSLLTVRSSQGAVGFLPRALLLEFSSALEVVFLPLLRFTVSACWTPPDLNPDLKATFAKVKWKLGRWSGGSKFVQEARLHKFMIL